MNQLRRRAIWIAAAVSLLAVAVGGVALLAQGTAMADFGRSGVHQAAPDHDVVVSPRLQAERPPLDLQQHQSKLLLLAWVSILFGAAQLASTVRRTAAVGTRRARPTVALRQRFDRGPPALSFR